MEEETPRNLAGVNAEVIAGGQRGWEADLREGSVFAQKYPSSIFTRVVRHRLAIRKDRVYHSSLSCSRYISQLFFCFSQHIAHSWRAVIVDIAWNEFRDIVVKFKIFFFCKASIRSSSSPMLSGFITSICIVQEFFYRDW